jgi:hypothetical protein
MKMRKWGRAPLGEWVFGSAMAWGCLAPIGANDLLSGSTGSCFGTSYSPCQSNGGPNCSSTSYCNCSVPGGTGNCNPKPPNDQCPSGCGGPNPGECDQGPMCPVYYH